MTSKVILLTGDIALLKTSMSISTVRAKTFLMTLSSLLSASVVLHKVAEESIAKKWKSILSSKTKK